MGELISIIVPVYNLEKYVDKCVKSIVNQTYRNLEIILVDDGSTDKSSKICDEWQKKDSRIKVLHKENSGLSDARNVGIEISTGKYLMFIDCDDYIEFDMVESLYISAIKNDADIVAGGFIYQTYYKQEKRYSKSNYCVNSEEALRKMLSGDDISQEIWDKLYKKKLFKTIKFPSGKIHEDIGILYKLIDKANKINHINKAGYHYVQRKESIVHSKFNSEQLSLIEFREDILSFVEEKYPRIIYEAENSLIKTLNIFTILAYNNKLKEEYKSLKNKLKRYMYRILKNPKIKLKDKFRSIMIVYFGFSTFYKKDY